MIPSPSRHYFDDCLERLPHRRGETEPEQPRCGPQSTGECGRRSPEAGDGDVATITPRSRSCGSNVSAGLLALFTEVRPALLRYLGSRGARPEEAEDILQDVQVKLLADGVGSVDQPRAYLYRMTNNHFLASRRMAGRRMRREEDWVSAQGADRGEIDQKPSAEAELIARQQLAILQRVLDALPERTRTIFRRFRIDGEPQRLIADELGISVSAVEKHLARAYQAIADVKLRLDEDRSTGRRLTAGILRHAP